VAVSDDLVDATGMVVARGKKDATATIRVVSSVAVS
jgi:hypothetical protein